MAFNIGDTVVVYNDKSLFSNSPYRFDVIKSITGWDKINLMSSQTVFNADGSSEYAKLLTLADGKVKIERSSKCVELNNKIKSSQIKTDTFINANASKVQEIEQKVNDFYNYINNL